MHVNVSDSPYHGNNRHSSRTRIHTLVFNITGLSPGERINLAELRLFTLIDRDRTSFMGVDRKVSVYEVNPYLDQPYILIDSKHIYGRSSGWETFEVTSAVKRWSRDIKSTQHVEIRIESIFHSVGNSGNLDINTRPLTQHEPLLVVFSNDRNKKRVHRKESQELMTHQRDQLYFPLDHQQSRDQLKFNNNSVNETVSISNNSNNSDIELSRVKRSSGKHCHRRDMWINFSDMGWDSWIVAPGGYQVRQYCACVWVSYDIFATFLELTNSGS